MDMVKQEMARVNINILGIHELKWTSSMNLIQMTIISTVGKNPLEEMEKPYSQQKSPKCNTWVQSQKQQNDLSLFPRQTNQH